MKRLIIKYNVELIVLIQFLIISAVFSFVSDKIFPFGFIKPIYETDGLIGVIAFLFLIILFVLFDYFILKSVNLLHKL